MVHGLAQRHPHNAVGRDPLTVTLRYRCECAANEVLAISVVIDMNTPEDAFVATMKQLRRDVQFEVKQHFAIGAPINDAPLT